MPIKRKVEPVTQLFETNIFLLIEQYLSKPTYKLAEQIKDASHAIHQEAVAEAAIKCHGKDIAADDYQPIILEKIKDLITQALPYSARFIQNNQSVTAYDPEYIFKLSNKQSKQINVLILSLLEIKKSGGRSPDGLIFAYGTYISRHTQESKLYYCSDHETLLYDDLAALYSKARKFISKKLPLGTILLDKCCAMKPNIEAFLAGDASKLQEIGKQLICLKEDPQVKTHRSVKKVVVNFLLALSVLGFVYLAATKTNRGTFWYHPNTDTANKVEDFENSLSKKK